MPTVPELFSDMADRLERNPEKTAGLTVTYQFNIEGEGGGIWHLRIANGKVEVNPGPVQDPDMVSILKVDDYVALATGQVSGRDLFFSGKMRVLGNPFLGIQLGQIMS